MSTDTAEAHVNRPFDRWLTRFRLRAVARLGSDARLEGGADIGGGGRIAIGDRFFLLSHPARSHMFAAPGASISIGDGVQISYGAAIAAQQAIDIGNDSVFGPFLVIMDNDFHQVGDRDAAGEAAPVHIGSRVNVGARVTILRGSVIGDHVRILSGSMVSGMVPSGVTIGGVPARVMKKGAFRGSIDMAELLQNVLNLDRRPTQAEGPEQIPAWDSLGSLRLLLAIEETHGVTLEEEEMRTANTVAALARLVEVKLSASARTAVDIPGLVQQVLDLSVRPQRGDGPMQIPAWDSLGTLRLLLAIEETYGISLSEEEMRAANNVAGLSGVVEAKLGGS